MKRIYILIRFDDICPTMNFKQFSRALKVLRKKGVKPLLGVIPDCKDPDLQIEKTKEDFWNWLKDLQNEGYAIAMHGYQHVFTTRSRGVVTRRAISEFSGHSLAEQIDKIKAGKDVLNSHGISTDIFFAPAHSYDENTLIALEQNGFKYMSDGKSSRPYMWHGIKCLPARSSGCPSITRSGLYTAVFHAHEWARADKANDYYALEELVNTHYKSIVSFDEYKAIKCGSYRFERLKEKLFVFIERNCLGFAVFIKHLFKI